MHLPNNIKFTLRIETSAERDPSGGWAFDSWLGDGPAPLLDYADKQRVGVRKALVYRALSASHRKLMDRR
jgi:hypothetical protein